MPRPLAIRRHDEILRRLRAAGSVSVRELADTFGISHETVRRDLKKLADQGHLDVVHGGAAHRGTMEAAVAQRPGDNAAGQAAIAREAVKLVPDAATVLLDAGATTAAIATQLVGRRGLTICTNSLANAAILCRVPGNRVYMLGGEVDPGDEATVGIDVADAIAQMRVDVGFVSVSGFAADGDPTDLTRGAAEMRGRMILSGLTYLVADQSKFALRTPFRIPRFEQTAGMIVDRAPEAGLADAWQARGLRIVVAE